MGEKSFRTERQEEGLKELGKQFGPTVEMSVRLLVGWAEKNKEKAVIVSLVEDGKNTCQLSGTGPQLLALLCSLIESVAKAVELSVEDVLDMLNKAQKFHSMTTSGNEDLLNKLTEVRNLLREAIEKGVDDD